MHVNDEDALIYLDLAHLLFKEFTTLDPARLQYDIHKYFQSNPFAVYGALVVASGLVVSILYYVCLLILISLSNKSTIQSYLPILNKISKIPAEEVSLLFFSSKQMIISIFAGFTALYGIVYADRVKGTTWYHCNYYKMHYFEY